MGLPDWQRYPDLCDIIQALLRLAPDGRMEALQRAGDLPGEAGAALRYALGANDVEIGPTLPLWVAAARARAPWADDERVERRFPDLGPGAGRIGQPEIDWNAQPYNRPGLRFTIEKPRHSRCDLPTTLLLCYSRDEVHWWTTPENRRWELSIWPQCCSPWWVSGAASVGITLGRPLTIPGDATILEPLIDPDEPITAQAADLLAPRRAEHPT